MRKERYQKATKQELLHPLQKRGKDSSYTDSYRGITVTSIQETIFEYVLLAKFNLISDNQPEMQFGFTPGLSHNMAELIVSEVCAEIAAREPLFYIDSRQSEGI